MRYHSDVLIFCLQRKIREEWEQQQMKEKEEVEHKRQERREREVIPALGG